MTSFQQQVRGHGRKKDSPTFSNESMKIVLAIMAENKWMPRSMDIKTAFLQGQMIDRDIYIKPPTELGIDKVWKLKKCVYGLGDASRKWYDRVKQVFASLGGQVSKLDPSVFYWNNENGAMIGLLACNVDDFIWSGN